MARFAKIGARSFSFSWSAITARCCKSLAGQERQHNTKSVTPLTATRMTRRETPAALYAPLRVVLYKNAAGRATYEYDRPSTLFGQFGDRQVTAVGRELDAEAERALRRAAE